MNHRSMMTVSSPARATGASLWGVLGTIFALVVTLTLVLKLGPHYIDWRTMQTIFQDLPQNEVHEMDKNSIRSALAKRFRVNSLRDFDLREILAIDRGKSGTTLIVAYEKRENIAMNVDVVVSFSETYKYQ